MSRFKYIHYGQNSRYGVIFTLKMLIKINRGPIKEQITFNYFVIFQGIKH